MIGSKLVFVVVALALGAGACKKDEASGPSKEPSTTKPEPAENTPEPLPPPAPRAGPAVPMLAAYERARALLAADSTSGLADVAAEIDRAATAAASSMAAVPADHLHAIAAAAKGLASAGDLKAARTAFGEVSRHVVALLAADKTLAEGQRVFECPMAEGYQKWVQPTAKLENPYMGTKMLSCGGESTWE